MIAAPERAPILDDSQPTPAIRRVGGLLSA